VSRPTVEVADIFRALGNTSSIVTETESLFNN
jgi:hypothetical protein